jgi:hypothetical protein
VLPSWVREMCKRSRTSDPILTMKRAAAWHLDNWGPVVRRTYSGARVPRRFTFTTNLMFSYRMSLNEKFSEAWGLFL